MNDVCRCGHYRNAHDHHRPGTDCSACACPAFEGPSLLERVRARLDQQQPPPPPLRLA